MPEDKESAVAVVPYGGRDFAMPFVDLMPKQTAEKLAELEVSISKHGVLVPIILNQDDVVIDGMSRFGIATKLKIPLDKIPFRIISVDWETAEELAIALNYARRPLDKEQRAELCKKLHNEKGWSFGRIADALGCSKTTVSYDITGRPPAESGDPKSKPANKPSVPPSDEAPNATGNIDEDWGLETGDNDDGDNTKLPVPGDNIAAAAKSGVTACGQLANALKRLGLMTKDREEFLQGLFTLLRTKSGLKEAA